MICDKSYTRYLNFFFFLYLIYFSSHQSVDWTTTTPTQPNPTQPFPTHNFNSNHNPNSEIYKKKMGFWVWLWLWYRSLAFRVFWRFPDFPFHQMEGMPQLICVFLIRFSTRSRSSCFHVFFTNGRLASTVWLFTRFQISKKVKKLWVVLKQKVWS